MIRLFSPTMDDYLYVLDLKEDYYMISPQAVERFRLPGDHFYHARGTHRTFVYAEDLKIPLQRSVPVRQRTIIWINAGWTIREIRSGLIAVDWYCMRQMEPQSI